MRKILFSLVVFFSFIGIAQADIFAQQRESHIVYEDAGVERQAAPQERYLLCGSYEEPITVVSFMNYPPFGWKETEYIKQIMDDDKKIHRYYGLGMDLFDIFARENGLDYVFVNMLNYEEAKYALSQGYFDILVTDYYDAETYQNVAYFYPSYLANPIVIVSLKSNTNPPQKLEDLVGKKGYVRKEENLAKLYGNSIPEGVEIQQVSGAKRAFYGLLKKEVDFILMSKYAYEAEIRRFKIEDYVTCSEKPVFTPFMFMSYSVTNPCAFFIKNALEESLKRYADDHEFMKNLLWHEFDVWKNKFADEKSLLQETGVPKEDVEEFASNINDWLKEQKEKAQKEKEAEAQKK